MPAIRRLFRSPVVRAVLSTFVLYLVTIVGALPPQYVAWVWLVIIAANFAVVYIAERSDIKRTPDQIRQLLKLLVLSGWGDVPQVRANVMIPEKSGSVLKVKHSYHMDGHIDRNLKLSAGTGCAGKAFSDKKPFDIDLTKADHRTYLVDPSRIWPAMRSVLCVPIFDAAMSDPIAILSVDSSLSSAEMKFQDEAVISRVNMFADLIGGILE